MVHFEGLKIPGDFFTESRTVTDENFADGDTTGRQRQMPRTPSLSPRMPAGESRSSGSPNGDGLTGRMPGGYLIESALVLADDSSDGSIDAH